MHANASDAVAKAVLAKLRRLPEHAQKFVDGGHAAMRDEHADRTRKASLREGAEVVELFE
jgi:hypothetical protein